MASASWRTRRLFADRPISSFVVEAVGWIVLSVSAGGFCAEVIFRGYLQLQFGAWVQSEVGGIVLSATISGAAHAYEGATRMVMLGVYGALSGVLATIRKSLRPGMMAHAWHYTLSGLVLGALRTAGR